MKPHSAKQKGRRFQQDVARFILAHFPELEEDDVVSRPMGSRGVDLMMSPLAQRTVGLSVECKNTKTKPGLGALDQAVENAYEDTLGLVAWKPPAHGYRDAVAYCYLRDLLAFLKGRS